MAPVNVGIPLSASDSLPIIISATSAIGTLIHTSDLSDHYINLWVNNIDTSPVTINILKGSSSTNYYLDSMCVIPPRTPKISLEPGILLTNSYELRIFASVANAIIVSGFVFKRSGE